MTANRTGGDTSADATVGPAAGGVNVRRVVLGLLGVTLMAAAILLGSGLGQLVPVEAAIGLLGNDYVLVAGFAVLAFVLALLVMLSGRPGNVRESTTPDPERAVELPVPGDEFDDAMASRVALVPFVGSISRAGLRDRLRQTTVNWVMREENCARSEAERRVDTGVWTDDEKAALFLARDRSAGERASVVLGSWVRLRPWTQVGAHRTALAIVAASDQGEHA